MRAVIISTGTYLDKRIERVLSNNGIKGDVATKITHNMVNVYDCVIFSHKYDIPNLPKVIERIVLEKKILVIYVNNTTSIDHYYNLINDLYFVMINEMTMDIELPSIINSNSKYVGRIISLENEVLRLKDQVKLLKLTNKAKLILMNKGLNEAESHKYIQKKSMEMRVSKLKLVNLIIENKIDI